MKVYTILLLLFAFCQSACNVTKHLDEAKGERLLMKNSFELKSPKHLRYSQRAPLLYELEAMYGQVPNRRPFIFFRAPTRLWLYYQYRDTSTKFERWIMKKVAEPPAIYDARLARTTARAFQKYVQQRGYFNAKCTYETTFSGKSKASVKYTLDLGAMHTIDTVGLESRDSAVLQILHEQAGKSLLKRGEPMDGRVFEAEKARITNELRNKGYAYFAPNFVQFSGDSTGTRTNVTTEILTAGDSAMHKTYTIGDIEFFSSVRPDIMAIRGDTTIEGVHFRSATSEFGVKPSRLYRYVALKPGQMYRQSDFDETLRRLNAIGVFRFVSVKPKQDTIDPRKINVEILTTPNKRVSFGADMDLNSSVSSSGLTRNLLGVSSSLTFRNRNLFRGAENLQTSARYNLEFDIAGDNDGLLYSEEFELLNRITFPRFFDYFGFWKKVNKWKKNRPDQDNSFYSKLKNDGQSRLSLNYNYLKIIDFYNYDLLNTTFGYDLQDGEHRYAFDHVGIDILRPETSSGFDSIFQNNQFLINSFEPQLFTGFLLRGFGYNYLGRSNRFGEHWFFRLSTDLSGLEELALNRLWSAAFGEQKWAIGPLEFAQYFRLDMDGVYTRDFRKNLTGVVRVGGGVVMPFGDSKVAPYVKQFFVGGPTSIRAWRIRQLGPGGYVDRDPDTGKPIPPTVQPFYQAADFRFEFNGELRFDIFSWFKGAVFLDGGNIWTLKPDPQRVGSQLRWDSFKNIALGTGFGIRGDFTYLIIRFDAGLKLRNPYADELGRYWVPNLISKLQWSDFNPNLAVGLPF